MRMKEAIFWRISMKFQFKNSHDAASSDAVAFVRNKKEKKENLTT